MNSYYDYIGKSILHDCPPPKGLTVDIVEKDDEPGLVYLRLYAVQVHDQPQSVVEHVRDWLQFTLDKLNSSLSIGKYTWEMVTEMP